MVTLECVSAVFAMLPPFVVAEVEYEADSNDVASSPLADTS
jgi:hypothetical protein